MGFAASGDAYTRRMDDLTEDLPNKVRIVDDTLLYEKGLPACFVATCRYIDLCARNRVVLTQRNSNLGGKRLILRGSVSRMMVLNRQRRCWKLLPIFLNLQI